MEYFPLLFDFSLSVSPYFLSQTTGNWPVPVTVVHLELIVMSTKPEVCDLGKLSLSVRDGYKGAVLGSL